MLKKFYGLAWLLLAMAALVTFFAGNLIGLTLLGFSVAALVLVYALALWAVMVDPQDTAGAG